MQLLTTEERSTNGFPRSRPLPPPPSGRRARGRLRRAPVLVGRTLLWAAVLVLLARGGLALVADLQTPAAQPASSTPAAATAPEPAGVEGFAVRFAYDYLTFDASRPAERAQRLAAYLPTGTEEQLGWDGIGEQAVRVVVPVSSTASADHVVVTVAAQVDQGRWLQLLVPVHIDPTGRLAVSAPPAFVPFSPPGAAPPRQTAVDADLSRDLHPVLESFFRAYGEGRAEDLAYFVAVGQRIRGLHGQVALEEVTAVRVGHGNGERTAEALVRWRDQATGAAFVQQYELGLVSEAGRWYVTRLGSAGATSPGGSP
jgi:hypothetical protein